MEKGKTSHDRVTVAGGKPVRKNLLPLHQAVIGEEEVAAAVSVLKSGNLMGIHGGQKGAEFERELSDYFGVSHAVTVNSGTSALHAVLACMGIGPGDEVLVPPLGFISTALAVSYQNAVPVYADVDPVHLNISAESIREKITPRTKAIIVVHLWGHPADMDPLIEIARENNLCLIEDCAQAHGAEYKGRKVGSFGDASCFSLVQTKIITAGGEGGFVLTRDGELAARMREFCNFARSETDLLFWGIGYNYRMPEIMGAIGSAQLGKLDRFIEKRRKNARYLTLALDGIQGVEMPREATWAKNVYWMFPLRVNEAVLGISRDQFVSALKSEGIGASSPKLPDHLQQVFTEKIGYGRTNCPFECPHHPGSVSYHQGLCPNAEKGASETLWLPGCSPAATELDLEDVVAAVKNVASCLRNTKSLSDNHQPERDETPPS